MPPARELASDDGGELGEGALELGTTVVVNAASANSGMAPRQL